MKNLLLIACLVSLSGCTVLKNKVSETNGSTNRTVTTMGFTFFDGKTAVAGLKASQSAKSQTIGVASQDAESSGTNVVNMVEGVVGSAVGAAIKAAKTP